jgi:molybdenum cofactor cytidylyltransferase
VRFLAVPIDQAEGRILGHNVVGADGRRLLRKGRPLDVRDLELLASLGRRSVYVAWLEEDDVAEDEAARRVTAAVAGRGVELKGPSTGRVNVVAATLGVLRVNVAGLDRLNEHSGVTLATLRRDVAVRRGRVVGTTKILPYAVPRATVEEAERIGREVGPLLWLDELRPRRVGLVVSSSAQGGERTVVGFATALRARLSALGAELERVDHAPLEEDGGEERLAATIADHGRAGLELIVLAGETAIQDSDDIAPRALRRAGGEVVCFGAPVDPGNLLMLGYLDGIPVLGAPGCARSPKLNIVDLLLPRLLVGDRIERADIARLGHGGLLEDVPERPMPRERAVDGGIAARPAAESLTRRE